MEDISTYRVIWSKSCLSASDLPEPTSLSQSSFSAAKDKFGSEADKGGKFTSSGASGSTGPAFSQPFDPVRTLAPMSVEEIDAVSQAMPDVNRNLDS